ncbi:hypothetical protein M407DRAFT_17580 [Tulasnella calospora MUT 4182]|uniref:C2H2-type domain-containing protein n=1 Tax=Tulasnella calospora MUT 4182 TaxID=1051891 RepID=A0A0C3LI01_9AGAM|nr:hypothetical protein M407DRAFT_17580 [Tulasnella calospora MUT 4182]
MSGTIEIDMDSDGVSLITLPASSCRTMHKCQTCYKAFSRYTDIRRHTDAVHLKIKSFKCEVCGKSFAQKIGLRTHMNGHSGNAPYECRIGCGHPPFRDPSSRMRHEYEKHAPPGFECPEGFKRKDALKAHVVHRHRDKAFTYTEEQMSSKMSRARFNEEFLRPAIERAKARRRVEGYVSDEDYDASKSALEDSNKPLALVSDAPLAAAVPSNSEGESVLVGRGVTTLDPQQSSDSLEHQEHDDTPMKSPRASSQFGQWVHTRDALKPLGHSPRMQTTPPRSAAPSPPTPPLPMSGRQIPHSPQRSSPLRSTPITAAPRLVPNELPTGTQSSPINTTFPAMTSPTVTFTNNNALGLDFSGPGGGNNHGLPYFSSSVARPIPAFPTGTTIDPTKHYYRRVVELPIGSHGQGFFSSPPSLMGSPTLSPAHQPVDANAVTLGGLSPSSRGVTDPSFLEDEIMI